MFKLPKAIVEGVVNGKIDYDDVPFDDRNELSKGGNFEDQARINFALEKSQPAMCSALEDACMKNACELYEEDEFGKIEHGWVCREYQADFPEAPFDLRLHLAFVGLDKVDIADSIENLQELKEKGAKYVCFGCNQVYANKPTELYDDGACFRSLDMCSCGSDLFDGIDSFINRLQNKK